MIPKMGLIDPYTSFKAFTRQIFAHWSFVKEKLTMIEIQLSNGLQTKLYDDYDDFVDSIMEQKNLKLLAQKPDVRSMNWSFVIYSPRRVAALYTHHKDPSEVIKEAHANYLPLIEICTGDYENPLQIVLTPNINLEYLKKKWCLDYCKFHHLIVRKFCKKETSGSLMSRAVMTCLS